MAFGLQTYQDSARRDDLIDALRYNKPIPRKELLQQARALAQMAKDKELKKWLKKDL